MLVIAVLFVWYLQAVDRDKGGKKGKKGKKSGKKSGKKVSSHWFIFGFGYASVLIIIWAFFNKSCWYIDVVYFIFLQKEKKSGKKSGKKGKKKKKEKDLTADRCVSF